MDPPARITQRENVKRTRQACANCRRRKTRCSGQQPICLQCRRTNNTCVYEPYSVTIAEHRPAAPLTSMADNVELLQRLSRVESQLTKLGGTSIPQRSPSINVPVLKTILYPLSDTPQTVVFSVIDDYFAHAHNQPYGYFEEASFRAKLQNNALPRCLLLAVLAVAVQYSSNTFYTGRTLEVSEVYAREAWLAVLQDELILEDNITLHVVQTANILAGVDYSAGRVNSSWMKIGLAARGSQAMGLMREPAMWLPTVEQEEWRRTFWSVYILDKLISCGRSRPIIIYDQDCQLQLPCSQDMFQSDEVEMPFTLHDLLDWNTDITRGPGSFAMVVLMASILGCCTRYLYGKRDDIPPWDTTSEYSAISTKLLLFESYAEMSAATRLDMMLKSTLQDGQAGAIDRQTLGRHIFARVLYNLCHCLLNHPFHLHLCCKPFGSRIPHSFVTRALQTGVDHATFLVDLLQATSEAGIRIESPFYSFCVAIAGGIHSIVSHAAASGHRLGLLDMEDHVHRDLRILDRLSKFWTHAANIGVRLKEFHTRSRCFAGLLDIAGGPSSLDPVTEEVVWSMLEYTTLGAASPGHSPVPGSGILNSPPHNPWALSPDSLVSASQGINEGCGIMPQCPMSFGQLDEIECLLN